MRIPTTDTDVKHMVISNVHPFVERYKRKSILLKITEKMNRISHVIVKLQNQINANKDNEIILLWLDITFFIIA